MTEDIPQELPNRRFALLRVILIVLGVIAALLLTLMLILVYAAQAPKVFPTNSSITVQSGAGVSEIVEEFKKAQYVRSELLLYAHLVFFHDTKDIQAGTYVFTNPLTVGELAEHITTIGPEEPLLTLTFPEGITVNEVAAIAGDILPEFNSNSFLSYALEREGFLFPDTYYVPDTFNDTELFDLLSTTYTEKMTSLQGQIDAHTLTETEIVILASILEREANSRESMRRVSSVLQNRLEIDMALQADASIIYDLDKPLSALTPEDLDIDSPYNTYLYKGLPPTPIGNPGLEAILAVLEPADTDYFYYLTAPDGTFHYAETFDEHRANIARYLR